MEMIDQLVQTVAESVTRLTSKNPGNAGETLYRALESIDALRLPRETLAPKLNPIVVKLIEQDKAELVSNFYQRFSGFNVVEHLLLALSDSGFKPKAFGALLSTPDFKVLLANYGEKLDQFIDKLTYNKSNESSAALHATIGHIKAYNEHVDHDMQIPVADIAFRALKKVLKDSSQVEKLTSAQVTSLSLLACEISKSHVHKIFDQIMERSSPNAKSPLAESYTDNVFAIIKDSITSQELSEALIKAPDSNLRENIEHTIRQRTKPKKQTSSPQSEILKSAGVETRLPGKTAVLDMRIKTSDIIATVEAGDLDAFRIKMVALEASPNHSGFQLAQIANAVITGDHGEMLQHMLDTFSANTTSSLSLIACLEKAGVIKTDRTVELRPSTAAVLLKHRDFKMLGNDQSPVVSQAMKGLAVSSDDRATKLLSLIIDGFPRKALLSGFVRDTLLDSLAERGKPHCFNSGRDEHFQMLAAALNADDCAKLIHTLTTDPQSVNKHQISSTMTDRLQIIARKMTQEQIDVSYKDALKHDNEQMLAALSPLATLSTPQEELIASCSVSITPRANTAPSLKKLEALLAANDFSEEVIFSAMAEAIGAKKKDHLLALVNYAHEQGMDTKQLLNGQLPDKSTLLTHALSLPFSREVVDMADVLVANGANGNMDGRGRTPMSLMKDPSFHTASSYTVLKRFLENRVDIATEEMKEGARIRGRLAAILEAKKALEAAGINDPEMLRIALGAAPDSSAQTSHVKRLENQPASDNGTDHPGRK